MEEDFLIDTFINDFMSIIEFLQGKKTYFVALAVGIIAACQFLGVLSPEAATILYGLLGATGLATLRAGITRNR